jgi:DNA polymerase-3 subunit chi
VTRIDFYFNAPDRLEAACRLAGEAIAGKARLLIYAPLAETAQRVDRMLWTSPAIGFVPHCAAHDPLAADTPILIASDTEVPEGCDTLLNLSNDCPPHYERFERVLEVVSTDGAEREAGRARYREYRGRGCKVGHQDLAREAQDE